jgi:hypothetical protein
MTNEQFSIRKRPQAQTIAWLLLLLLASYAMATAFTSNLPFSYAVGCDAFGYVRQAELIREKGVVSGLDTELTAPEADFLKQIARQINTNPRIWSEMIAPHCHHYRPATDKIIMQYPPGTGMVLAALPQQKMLQALSLLMVLSILLFYVRACLSSATVAQYALSTAVVLTLLAIVTKFQVASYSIPVSIVLITGLVLLLTNDRSVRPRLNDLSALAIGLLSGLLIDVRIASALLLPAVGVIFFFRAQLAPTIGAKLREHIIALTGFGFAIMPLLIANSVNVGSPFVTTYGEYDTSVQWRNLTLLATNLNYYFLGGHLAAPLAVMTLVLVLVLGVLGRRAYASYLALIIVFVVNVAFFAIKPIAMDYYLVPLLTFCTLFSVSVIAKSAPETIIYVDERRKRFLLVVMTLLALAFGAHRLSIEPVADLTLSVPAELKQANSIVYADTSGGTIYQYAGKYTSKIAFASVCMQVQLVHAVSRAGRQQYFVIDSPKMQAVISEIGKEHFEKIGAIKSPHMQYDVMKYVGTHSGAYPQITCDFNSDPAIVSKLELTLRGQLQGDRYVGTVDIVNRSATPFSTRPNAFPIRLAWRVVPTDTPSVDNKVWPNRIDLNLMLSPNQSQSVPIDIAIPRQSTDFNIEFTLVQEGLAWLHERGMKTTITSVRIK